MGRSPLAAPAEAVHDLADRVELEVGMLLAQLFDGLVRRHVVAAEGLELLPDLVVADGETR